MAERVAEQQDGRDNSDNFIDKQNTTDFAAAAASGFEHATAAARKLQAAVMLQPPSPTMMTRAAAARRAALLLDDDSLPDSYTPTGSGGSQPAQRGNQPAQKKQRTAPTRIRVGDNADDTVLVSSGVTIAAGRGGPGSSDEDDADNNRGHRAAEAAPREQQPHRVRQQVHEQQPNPPAQAARDNQQEHQAGRAQPVAEAAEAADADWWDAMTPQQQRSMMLQLLNRPPAVAAAASAPPRIIVQEQPRRSKRKKLLVSNFYGKPDESVEAWLASVLKEAENQEHLGGDVWTVDDLYHGATQHLKGKAEKWFITWSQHVRQEDQTFAFLVKKMRGKYGRRDNAFQVQQRLAKRKQQPGERLTDFADSLVDIGFGKNVSDETYKEAFLTGMNNEGMATNIRTLKPPTMEDAVQLAIETCGEYGEGLSVTSWKAAQRRYRTDGDAALGEDSSTKRKTAKSEMASQFDWKQLGFGADAQPMYNTAGEAVNGLAETAKKDPLSLATLRALMVMVGVGDKTAEASEQNTKPTASKGKARALEVKAERAPDAAAVEKQTAGPGREWQPQPAGTGGRGFGSRWTRGGRGGGGRGTGLENYGPLDNRPIAQRKAETACSYCGLVGHWWRECATRQAHSNATVGQQTTTAASSNQASDDTEEKAAAPGAQGNERRQ